MPFQSLLHSAADPSGNPDFLSLQGWPLDIDRAWDDRRRLLAYRWSRLLSFPKCHQFINECVLNTDRPRHSLEECALGAEQLLGYFWGPSGVVQTDNERQLLRKRLSVSRVNFQVVEIVKRCQLCIPFPLCSESREVCAVWKQRVCLREKINDQTIPSVACRHPKGW
jgi:hypothetical protein